MRADRHGGERSARSSPQAGVVVNGWTIFAHPLFLDQLESLLQAVEGEINRGKRDTSNQKVLRAIYRYAFVEIPKNPNEPRFRQGNIIKQSNENRMVCFIDTPHA